MITQYIKIQNLFNSIQKFFFSFNYDLMHEPELNNFLKENQKKQKNGINLIPNDNYPSTTILTRLNNILSHSINSNISSLENITIKKCLNAFNLHERDWYINIKENSQSNINISAILSTIGKNSKIMSLNYYHGGDNIFGFEHLNHNFFNNKLYEIEPQMGIIDMEKLYNKAIEFKPNLIFICGNSYPRDWDYEKFKYISNKINCLLMCDMSLNYGLICSNLLKNPFNYCDIITMGSNLLKSGIIFYNKKTISKILNYKNNKIINNKNKIHKNFSSYNNILSIIANQMIEIKSSNYINFSKQIKKNSKSLSKYLLNEGNRLSSNGTDTHLILWDLKPLGINGNQLKKTMELVNIDLKEKSIVNDSDYNNPEGILINVYNVTYKGIKKNDIRVIGNFLMRGVKITQKYYNFKEQTFQKLIENDNEIPFLKRDVMDFVKKFTIDDVKY